MIRRVVGVVVRPRSTMAELAARPSWLGPWLLILATWGLLGASLLLTDVGRQAVVDERVRIVEALGGVVSDSTYAAWQADPPWAIYLASGGRQLLNPAVTLAVAAALWLLARGAGARPRFAVTLSMAVHASVVLLLGQIVALPLHFVRESLTSPLNLAAVLPGVDEGTWLARLLGVIELSGLWWLTLLAIGASVLTGRPWWRHAGQLLAAYLVIAAALALGLVVVGGA